MRFLKGRGMSPVTMPEHAFPWGAYRVILNWVFIALLEH